MSWRYRVEGKNFFAGRSCRWIKQTRNMRQKKHRNKWVFHLFKTHEPPEKYSVKPAETKILPKDIGLPYPLGRIIEIKTVSNPLVPHNQHQCCRDLYFHFYLPLSYFCFVFLLLLSLFSSLHRDLFMSRCCRDRLLLPRSENAQGSSVYASCCQDDRSSSRRCAARWSGEVRCRKYPGLVFSHSSSTCWPGTPGRSHLEERSGRSSAASSSPSRTTESPASWGRRSLSGRSEVPKGSWRYSWTTRHQSALSWTSFSTRGCGCLVAYFGRGLSTGTEFVDPSQGGARRKPLGASHGFDYWAARSTS